MRATRERLFKGFGSCSWREPVDDLRALGWLDVTLAYGVLRGGGVCARVDGRVLDLSALDEALGRALAERASWRAAPASGHELAGRVGEGRELESPELALPFAVADYVDFYSSLHHATNLGPDVPARLRAAAAQLAPPAGGLPRPRRHRGGERHAGAAPERPAARARVRARAGGSTSSSRPAS